MSDPEAFRLLQTVEESGDVDATMALLRKFFRGFPVEHLRRLLFSDNRVAVKSGAFLVTELGKDAQPIWKDAATLLTYPDHQVRGDVLDSILLCSQPADGAILASAANLLNDPHPYVRWKLLRLFATLDPDRLESAARLTSGDESEALTWLTDLAKETVPADTIGSALASPALQMRLIAVSGALRVFKNDPQWLDLAARSEHEEVATNANDLLSLEKDLAKIRGDRHY